MLNNAGSLKTGIWRCVIPADAGCSTRVETATQMKSNRDAEKERFIAAGLMNDPYKPVSLKDAITMVGTCTDMCPEYERYEREYQNNVDRWEAVSVPAQVDAQSHLALRSTQLQSLVVSITFAQ